MSTSLDKPKRGRPKAGSDDAVAVAYMEAEVVRLAQAGRSFYAIDGELGITNSDRIFRRAVDKGRTRTREDAYALESLRLEGLWAIAWEKLQSDALPNLADRIVDMCEGGDVDADTIRRAIESAFDSTWRGLPVAAALHEKRSKLDGLGHADRVADAQLQINVAQVQLWAGLLVQALDVLNTDPADKVLVLERMRELSETHAEES